MSTFMLTYLTFATICCVCAYVCVCVCVCVCVRVLDLTARTRVCRTMGYLIRHIHNRDLATENIMTAYVRLRFILKKFPRTIEKMVHKFEAADKRIPRGGSTLQLATDVRTPSHILTRYVDIYKIMSTYLSKCRHILTLCRHLSKCSACWRRSWPSGGLCPAGSRASLLLPGATPPRSFSSSKRTC